MRINWRLLVASMTSLGLVVVILYYMAIKRHRSVDPDEPEPIRRPKPRPEPEPCVGNVIYKRGEDICIWGHVNPIPLTDSELKNSSYNEGSMRIDGHPFVLHRNGNLRIYRHWWSFSDTQFIVKGYSKQPGHYFVQTPEGLFYVSTTSTLHLTSEIYEKLLFYEENPYVLKGGRLYRCPSPLEFITANFKLHMNHWQIEPINFIGGFDIRFMDIADVSCASNDELILVVASGRVLYIPTSKESDLINQRYLKDVMSGQSKYHNPFEGIRLDLRVDVRSVVTPMRNQDWRLLPIHRITLGDTSDTFLIFYNHSVSVVHKDKILMSLNGIKQAAFGVIPGTLYVLDLSGRVYAYDDVLGVKTTQNPKTLSQHMRYLCPVEEGLLLVTQRDIMSKLR